MSIKSIEKSWELVVIGGGVTGAAIFREAVRMGIKVILLEKKDFAWGTSSRSSKMVHGGLRYLKEGKFFLTRDSVKERQRLLAEAPGLIEPLGFLMPVFSDFGPSKTIMNIGLSIYSLMALEKQHISYNVKNIKKLIPYLKSTHLTGGFYFKDAQVDDARLVLRLINEGVLHGGLALNYTCAKDIHRNRRGNIAAITAEDIETKENVELRTKAVINATGVWAEKLHPSPEKGIHIRALRGSHLIFPQEILPIDNVISFIHPKDKRPVFVFPWEKTSMLGTTDLDHDYDINIEPAITQEETSYLMEGLHYIMPGLKISQNDCISSIAGVRPVLSKKKGVLASNESREHVVWENNGLITVTGGKFTTFRLMARDALKKVCQYLPEFKLLSNNKPVFDTVFKVSKNIKILNENIQESLFGRYGNAANTLADSCDKKYLTHIRGTSTLWAELVHTSKNEQVRHLSDLLLRHTRIGLLLPIGAIEHFNEIKEICKKSLRWDDNRWEIEKKQYLKEWEYAYAPPNKKNCRRKVDG